MTDKKYKVIVSDKVKKMLEIHMKFLAKKSKGAATNKKRELITAMRSLEHMPERFPFFEEDYVPKNKYHKMFVQKWYIILYQIQDDIVYVDYILDCRKDYGWLVI